MKDIIDLVGRVFMSFIFLYQATMNILEPSFTKKIMVQHGIESQINFLYLAGIVLMVLGGIMVLIGYRARLGAFLLLVFLIPSTLQYYLDLSDPVQQQVLLRNIAIMGGLMVIMANGSGKYSIKRMLAGVKK